MIGRCTLLFLAGTALQLSVGHVDASFLVYPWTVVVAVNYLYIHLLLYANAGKYSWMKGLYDRPAYLTSLISLLVLTLFFGLIPQDGSTEGLWGILGFTRMSTSWIFVLFLLQFLTALGMKVMDDVHHWRKRKLPVVVMHVACLVVMLASVVGSGEKVRLRVMTVQERPVSVGMMASGKMVELPFSLTLREFSMEKYPTGEVKKYLSKVVVSDGDGTREVDIMVNHPARVGAWRIYQSAYDHVQGKWVSILECVKDGWYPVVHVSMWLILAGGVWMMFGGWSRRNQKKKEDRG